MIWTPDDVIALIVVFMLFVFVLIGYDDLIVRSFILVVLGYFGLTIKRRYR